MVSHQLHVRYRPEKVRRTEPDVLPLSYTANHLVLPVLETDLAAHGSGNPRHCFTIGLGYTSQSGLASDFASIMSTFKSTMEDMLRRFEHGVLDVVTQRLDAIKKQLSLSSSHGATSALTELVPQPHQSTDVPDATEATVAAVANGSSKNWAEFAKDLSITDSPFVAKKTNSVKRKVRVRGQASVSALKVIPRQLTCFVERIHPDVSEEDLASFLMDRGIRDVQWQQYNTQSTPISFKGKALALAGAPLRDS